MTLLEEFVQHALTRMLQADAQQRWPQQLPPRLMAVYQTRKLLHNVVEDAIRSLRNL
jgi:hypothetical protein